MNLAPGRRIRFGSKAASVDPVTGEVSFLLKMLQRALRGELGQRLRVACVAALVVLPGSFRRS